MRPSARHCAKPPRKRWRKTGWISGLALLLGGIVLVAGFAEEQRLAELLRHSSPQWLLAAAALQALTYVSAAAILRLSLAFQGEPRPLLPLVPLGLAKLFTDQAVPSAGLSGTVFIVHALKRRGVPREPALGSVLLSLIAYYLAYALTVAISLLILWLYGDLNRLFLILATAFSAIALAVPLAAVWLHHHPGSTIPPRLQKFPLVRDFLSTIGDASPKVLRPAFIARTALLHSTVFLLDALTLSSMLRAVGTSVDFAAVFAAFIMASVFATLMIVPGGLGTFEGASVAMLLLFGVPLEAAVTATLLLRGFTFWLPMIPGLWLARREMRPP